MMPPWMMQCVSPKTFYALSEDKLYKSKRTQTISEASHVRNNGLAAKLPEPSDQAVVHCLENCISRYVSPSTLQKNKKREHPKTYDKHINKEITDQQTSD